MMMMMMGRGALQGYEEVNSLEQARFVNDTLRDLHVSSSTSGMGSFLGLQHDVGSIENIAIVYAMPVAIYADIADAVPSSLLHATSAQISFPCDVSSVFVAKFY